MTAAYLLMTPKQRAELALRSVPSRARPQIMKSAVGDRRQSALVNASKHDLVMVEMYSKLWLQQQMDS